MKQIGSAITGSQNLERTQQNSTGLQPGATGADEPSKVAPKIDRERLAKVNGSLTRFATLALKDEIPIDLKLEDVENVLAEVEGKCDWNEAHLHLIEIIDAYARPGVTEDVIKIRARSFMAELDRFPTWAVIQAFDWWKSSANQYRFRAPQPGDISEQCKLITDPMRISRNILTKMRGANG